MDRPKLLGEPEAQEDRLRQLYSPHIAPLTRFVADLRVEAGNDVSIPYFDPWDGGIHAEILLLLEAPGPKAVNSSFVSRNNPDETAKNLFEISQSAGLPRSKTIIWNAVPWYIGNGARIRAATPTDLENGLKPLPRLLCLLPKLRAVILLGRKARKAASVIARENPSLHIFECPHPSPMFVNRAPGNKNTITNVFCMAAAVVQGQQLPDSSFRV